MDFNFLLFLLFLLFLQILPAGRFHSENEIALIRQGAGDCGKLASLFTQLRQKQPQLIELIREIIHFPGRDRKQAGCTLLFDKRIALLPPPGYWWLCCGISAAYETLQHSLANGTRAALDMSSESVFEDSPLIFVVDDDKSMRMLLRLALEQEGYQVFEAQDGAGCLAAYQHQKPDAILLDALMPGMDGFACCTKLRTFPGFPVPVLMITVLDEPDAVDQAFAVGATDYITKPIHWTVLRHRLRYLLQQSRLYQQLKQELQQANRKLERLACLLAGYEAKNLN